MAPDLPPEFAWLTAAGEFIRTAGMPGIIAALIWPGKVLRNDIIERDARINELQEKRATEIAKATEITVAALTASTAHLANSTVAIQEVARLQQASLDLVRLVPPGMESIRQGLDRNAGKIDDALANRTHGGAR